MSSTRIAALVLGIWTLLCFAPVIRGPFFFDDEHFIQKNVLVHDLAHVREIYTTAVTQGASIRGNFYRPNQQLIYAALYSAVGETTTVPYHLAGILLHLVAGGLLWLLLMELGVGAWPALAGTGVFLLHPVQTEAICYISGLADPLAMVFELGALNLVARATGWGRVAAAWGLTVLALLSKESGVVVAPEAVALVAGLALWRGQRPRREAVAAAGGMVVLAGVYSWMRMTVLSFGNGFGLTESQNAYTESLALRLKTFVSVLWDYAALLVAPTDLNYEKPYRAYDDLATGRGVFGILVILAVAVAVARARRNPRLALAASLAAAAMIPFIGLVPLNAMYLEHWLYGAMVGLALLVALGVAAMAPKGKDAAPTANPALTLVVVVLVALSVRTAVRARDWASPEAFYLNELAVGGPSIRVLNNLGMYYSDKNQPEKAVTYYRDAIAASGALPFPQPHHNLARALAAAGQVPEAVAELHEALKIDPGFVYSLAFLRDIYGKTGEPAKASLTDQALTLVSQGKQYDFAAYEAAVFGGSGK